MNWVAVLIIDTMLGWATNVIAIKMLTRPHQAYRYIPIQGLIPKSINRFADGVAKLVAEHLLNNQHILEIMNDDKLEEAAKEHITNLVAQYVVSEEYVPLPTSAIREVVDDLFKNVSFTLPANLITPGSVEKAISTRIQQMPMPQIESLIHSTAKSEFKFIELVGAAIGFTIGLCQILIF